MCAPNGESATTLRDNENFIFQPFQNVRLYRSLKFRIFLIVLIIGIIPVIPYAVHDGKRL